MVGLRFFTVYGPWGRSDMAVYKFAEKILENEPVPKFETNDGILERDFTYIDDIINGVMATLSYTPRRCGEVFNLGYGHPENLLKMIGYLEEAVGKKAVLAPKPVPPSELLKTYADISLSRQLLGYNPTTSLKIGENYLL
uniref:UDP-glucuronate 4-epimerase 4-like n=1 Tax=Saccoglossus kowalevskii TaxID=10224 RepID=A0ABM0MFK0_SACKO|nr:PREDICTED: UDP-glucuronate 4-epimerase 4-like [Saccoglossus kowalevskii]